MLAMTKAKAYCQLARFDRPIGSLLLLWPTLWALFLAADGFPNWEVLIVFVLGVIFMRAAGCVINDFADRNFDGHVKRTAHRPMPRARCRNVKRWGYLVYWYWCHFYWYLP